MEKQNKMGVMPVNRLVWSISFPLMFSMLIQSLYNIVDGIFVAKISENALTATSLAYPIQMLMIAVSVGTGVGVNALLSQTLGKRDFEKVSKVAQNGLFAAIAGSLVFIVLGLIIVPAFIGAYTDDAQILADGISYLRICMIFSSGIFLATTGERCLQATGKTWLSMIAQTIGAVCNIILDPIFIFGLFGIPRMGVTGAAIATVIGQWAAAITSLLLNKIKNKEVKITVKGFTVDGTIMKEIYRVGFPSMVTSGIGSVMVVCMNKILVPFSTTAVAFFGVYYKLQNFLYMPTNGLAQGLIPIVGYNYGAGNMERVLQALKTALIGAIVLMLCGTAIFWIFPVQLLGLYDAGAELLAIGVPALRIISLTFVVTGVTVTIGYYFSGQGNAMINMVASLIRQLVLLLPLAYLFASRLGLGFTWYAFVISELVAGVFAVICCIRRNRKLRESIQKIK
jgi:putative MATE family efflux protein